MGGGNGLSTGGSAVFVKPVIFNTFIEAVPTREVVTVKTVLGKNPAGDITAQTRLAHDVDRLCAVQFRHPLPQVIHWNMFLKAFGISLFMFGLSLIHI